MNDIHIDDFYKDSALILLQLYSQFPRKITLFVEDIAGPDTIDDFGLHSQRHLACFSTISWLEESGYLSYEDTIRQDAMDQVVLSHKAFTLLASPASTPLQETHSELPESVAENLNTNVAQLRNAVKSGSSHAINQRLRELLVLSRQHST